MWLNDLKTESRIIKFFLPQYPASHTLHPAVPLCCTTLLLSTAATPFLRETGIALCFVIGW